MVLSPSVAMALPLLATAVLVMEMILINVVKML